MALSAGFCANFLLQNSINYIASKHWKVGRPKCFFLCFAPDKAVH